MILELSLLYGAWTLAQPLTKAVGSLFVGAEIVSGRVAKRRISDFQGMFERDENPVRDSQLASESFTRPDGRKESKAGHVFLIVDDDWLRGVSEEIHILMKGAYLLSRQEADALSHAIADSKRYELEELPADFSIMNLKLRTLSRWNHKNWKNDRPSNMNEPWWTATPK